MITRLSVPYLAEDIYLINNGIRDNARNYTFKINETGYWITNLIDGKKNIEQISKALSLEYRLNEEEARYFVVNFLYQLNRSYLINLYTPLQSRKINPVHLYLLAGGEINILKNITTIIQQAAWKRIKINISNATEIIIFLGRITFEILVKYIAVWLLLTITAISSLASWSPFHIELSNFTEVLPATVIFIVGVVLGLSIHEIGHALAFINFTHTNQKPFLVVKQSSVVVVCPNETPLKEAIVAISGPFANILVAILLYLIGMVIPSQLNTKYIIPLLMGISLASYSIIPIFPDGKRFFSIISSSIVKFIRNKK